MVLGFLSMLNASAFSTGIPIKFTVDPATVRQGEKQVSSIMAHVTLQAPSPTYFICQIRSSDKDDLVTFDNIIFKKGQTEGMSSGRVHWQRIPVDCQIKISAFSVDAPEGKLWFTISLKTKNEVEDEPANGQAPADAAP